MAAKSGRKKKLHMNSMGPTEAKPFRDLHLKRTLTWVSVYKGHDVVYGIINRISTKVKGWVLLVPMSL